ncbi:phosphatidylserine decarboxylase [Pseudalkalibacillus caeni]|uniref:Phosphatidylserine decarboxylase proenzyme n=1 Tax=Exobacillus caeni TaxID=2574798 RepID=A0A5R9F8F0_9BACL|nr:phosphatidylserine decarboxylase [Pseudalkalibacillus caeni]TLS39321.1 phosphatidylserine decarboxylase [Pseudalkalibacillus caeni]
MIKIFFRSFVELTGHPFSSMLLKKYTKSRWSKGLVKPFARAYNINEQEMEKPLQEFLSLHELFTRKLKEGARLVSQDEQELISPVDGKIELFGEITNDCRFHVKGQEYSIEEMLGSKEKAKKYERGVFFILYLSPSHYHRIHSPAGGMIKNSWKLGGKSFPVNRLGLKYGERPLSTNFRLITELERSSKSIAVVKVGALNVNSICTTYTETSLKKGEEIGYFSFGSTVVLLIEKDTIQVNNGLQPGQDIRVGNCLGTFLDED